MFGGPFIAANIPHECKMLVREDLPVLSPFLPKTKPTKTTAPLYINVEYFNNRIWGGNTEDIYRVNITMQIPLESFDSSKMHNKQSQEAKWCIAEEWNGVLEALLFVGKQY